MTFEPIVLATATLSLPWPIDVLAPVVLESLTVSLMLPVLAVLVDVLIKRP
jgi:hypothetical protein